MINFRTGCVYSDGSGAFFVPLVVCGEGDFVRDILSIYINRQGVVYKDIFRVIRGQSGCEILVLEPSMFTSACQISANEYQKKYRREAP